MADPNMSIESLPPTTDTSLPPTASGSNMDLPPLPSADPKIRFIQESAGLQFHDPEALKSLKSLLKDYKVEGATPEEMGLQPDEDALKRAAPEFTYPTDPNEKRALEIAIGAASGFYKFQTPEDTATADKIIEMLRDPGRRVEGMKELDRALEAKNIKKDS